MYWLRRALGFAAVSSEETPNDVSSLQEPEELPEDPTTDAVPKPMVNEVDSE